MLGRPVSSLSGAPCCEAQKLVDRRAATRRNGRLAAQQYAADNAAAMDDMDVGLALGADPMAGDGGALGTVPHPLPCRIEGTHLSNAGAAGTFSHSTGPVPNSKAAASANIVIRPTPYARHDHPAGSGREKDRCHRSEQEANRNEDHPPVLIRTVRRATPCAKGELAARAHVGGSFQLL
jgi:hypothetical protein